MSGVKLPKRLSVPQQRMLFESLSPMDKQHIRTAWLTHQSQSGGKFIDDLKSFTKKAGIWSKTAIDSTIIPVLKYLGPTVLKEIVLPLAKKKIGLGCSKTCVGKGINTAGRGLRLAGQGRKKKVPIPSVARKALKKKITQLPKVKH